MSQEFQSRIARIAIDSPLPNLDRLFDYEIPNGIDTPNIGARVKVPFGRSKSALDGFIVEINPDSNYSGKLSPIQQLVSDVPVLPKSLYALLRATADRQAATLGDLLKLAVPARSVGVEKRFVAANAGYAIPKSRTSSHKVAKMVAPSGNSWVAELIAFARRQVDEGFSAILLVPDFRDQILLRDELQRRSIEFVDFSTDRKGSERYASFLQCLTPGNHIVLGSRNSIYAPLNNLGGIAVYDDSDDNFVEPTSPYVHSRDVALVRQQLSNCDLLFAANYRSVEVQRLVEIGFLSEEKTTFVTPNLATTDDVSKLPTMAWEAIRECLNDRKQPVLIQVAGKGVARSSYCFDCGVRAKCNQCHGPIWIDASNIPRCRWCSSANLAFSCNECGGTRLKQGAGGATRTAAEIGKSFPGAQVIESTGDKPLTQITNGKKVVISTPGAEPEVQGGYGCVVILDALTVLSRDSLRAQDRAIRNWTNAIAKLANGGRGVISGVPQHLGQRLALWQLREIASEELVNRKELEFPPFLRLASIQGEKIAVSKVAAELKEQGHNVLGPISIKSDKSDLDHRYVIKYSYAAGPNLAKAIKGSIAANSAGSVRTSSNGRISRVIRVRMDDPEVI